jgi:predicted transcriptional regulator of viral defense system
VYVALPRNVVAPRLAYPPIRIFWFTGKVYSEGVEEHNIDDTLVKVYCVEKTIADCFKYRNKLGLDVALEVLKWYFSQGERNVEHILHYAKICRVDKVMTPYIEAMI